MSISTVDTIVIIEETPIDKLLNSIANILSKYKFEFKTEFENYWLEETDKEQYQEAISVEINSIADARLFFEKLKKHHSGGTISYFSPLLKSSVLFSLQSIETNDINVLIFYFDHFDKSLIIPFFQDLGTVLKFHFIFCGEENDDGWDERQIIDSALLGQENKDYLMPLDLI